MERESPPKILQLKAVCTTLPFVLSYKPTGPPNSTRGLPFIYLLMTSVISLNALLHFELLSGTGFD